MHIYRWDLDKTYLETDFGSLRGLVRAATERADQKRAFPGAASLLRALAARPSARVYILSGSPEQLRPVLQEKLRLDGVRADGFILKDNLGNLKRGRIRAIRGQFDYKLPILFEARRGIGAAVQETLFGDDAEVDALVYSVYADAMAGRLSPAQVSRVLELAGAYPDRIAAALEALSKLNTGEVVSRIFIHLERGSPPQRFAALGPRLVPVYSWWQAALVLYGEGHIGADAVDAVTAEVQEREGLGGWAMEGLAQDLVRRGHLDPEVLGRLAEREPAGVGFARCHQAALRLGAVPPPPPPAAGIDYLQILSGWARAERRKAE